jgi:hypothetical protein
MLVRGFRVTWDILFKYNGADTLRSVAVILTPYVFAARIMGWRGPNVLT